MKAKNGNDKKKPNGKNGGRPTRLTKAVQRRLLSAIERGHYYTTACQLAGISYPSFREWQMKGEQGLEPYAGFLTALKMAEALAEDVMLQIVLAAPAIDGKNWQAAMTFLERRHPDRWGRKDRIHAEHSGGIKLEVEWSEHDGSSRHSGKASTD